MPEIIYAGRENANDDFFVILAISVHAGAQVSHGQSLMEIEGSKAVVDVVAPSAGFFFPLVAVGDKIAVGDPLAALAETSDFDPASLRLSPVQVEEPSAAEGPLASGFLVSELLTQREPSAVEDLSQPLASMVNPRGLRGTRRPRRLVTCGGGQAFWQVHEALAAQREWTLVGCYDDRLWTQASHPQGFPVLGPITREALALDYQHDVFDGAIVAFGGSIHQRVAVFDVLMSLGIMLPTLIHPTASVDSSATIGRGNLILPFVHVGPHATIGDNNFFSSYCNIEHHCEVADHNTFGPGVMFSGGVRVGSRVRFGTGIFIEPKVVIGDDCTVASGSVVTKNIESGVTVKSRSRA